MKQDTTVDSEKTKKTFWKRLANIYQTVALLVFNTLLFIIITFMVINLLLPPKDTATALADSDVVATGVNTTYSTYFDRSAYYLSSPDEVNAMLDNYDRMARNGHWMVHPWTGLTMRPFKSQYLNIDANGLRVNIPVESAHANQQPFVVWAFGGSTLFGWGLADHFSIPARLQTELQKQMPDRQVQVVNFAEPIYNSSQELALFVANLRVGKPDVAFFFDGINDLWFTLQANTQTPLVEPLAAAWEQNTYEITHQQAQNADWFTVQAGFPPLRLAKKLGIEYWSQSPPIQYAMRGINRPTRGELLEAAVSNYATNRRMANAIASEFGVKVFFFLQPYLTDKVDFPVFRTQIAQETDTTHYYDISTMLTGNVMGKHKALIDYLHYSDFASGMIAGRIADILLKNDG